MTGLTAQIGLQLQLPIHDSIRPSELPIHDSIRPSELPIHDSIRPSETTDTR